MNEPPKNNPKCKYPPKSPISEAVFIGILDYTRTHSVWEAKEPTEILLFKGYQAYSIQHG